MSIDTNIKIVGNKLFSHIFTLLDKNKPIYINLIKSESNWINKYKELIVNNGFTLYGDTIENGVPVSKYIYDIGMKK